MDWDMEWDLWGPPNHQDVIEETAVNEKYCVQLLRILVVNADTEINELEKELVSLLCELALLESPEWSEICCNALQKRIDQVDISVKNLKDKDMNDLDSHTQPAESLHDIIKTLLKTCGQLKDGEPTNLSFQDSSFNYAANVADLEKSTALGNAGNANSNVSVKETVDQASTAMVDNGAIVDTSQKLQLNIQIDPDSAEPEDIALLTSSSYCPENAFKGTRLRNVNSNSKVKKDVKVSISATEKSCVVFESSLEYQGKKAEDHATFKLLNDTVAPSTNPLKLATGHSDEKNKSTKPSDGVTNSSSSDNDRSEDLSLKYEDEENPGLVVVKEEHQDDRGKDENLNAHKHASGSSNMRKLCRPDPSVNGKGEREYSFTALGKSIISNTVVDHEGINNIPEANECHSDIDRDPGLVAGEHASSHSNMTNKSCKSDLIVKRNRVKKYGCATSKSVIIVSTVSPKQKDKDNVLNADEVELGCADMEQTLCEFASRASHKRRIKESRVAQSDKIGYLASFSKGKGKRKRSQQLVKSREASLTDTEHSPSSSLLELQDSDNENLSILLPEDFNFITSLKLQKQTGKNNVESDSSRSQGSLMEIIPSSGYISKAKKLQKSRNGFDISGSSHPTIGKVIKDLGRPPDVKESIAASIDCQVSYFDLQKTRKSCLVSSPLPPAINCPTAKMDSSKSHVPHNTPDQDLSIANSFSNDDSCIDAVESSMPKRTGLENMTMSDLKAIAKQLKIPNWHKLRKAELTGQLADQLELNAPSGQEPAFPSMEFVPSLSSTLKAKRQQGSDSGYDINSMIQTFGKNTSNLPCEARDHITAYEDSHFSLVQLQKKRKRNSALPSPLVIENSAVRNDFSKSIADLLNPPGHALPIIDPHMNDDSCTESVTSSPSKTQIEKMTACELRVIAKSYKLPKVHKLRKHELVEQIIANQKVNPESSSVPIM